MIHLTCDFAPFSYLQVEWQVRRGTSRLFTADTMRSAVCRLPLQDNSSDCGLYLLQYAETFLQVPPLTLSPPHPVTSPLTLYLLQYPPPSPCHLYPFPHPITSTPSPYHLYPLTLSPLSPPSSYHLYPLTLSPLPPHPVTSTPSLILSPLPPHPITSTPSPCHLYPPPSPCHLSPFPHPSPPPSSCQLYLLPHPVTCCSTTSLTPTMPSPPHADWLLP